MFIRYLSKVCGVKASVTLDMDGSDRPLCDASCLVSAS